MEEQKWQSISLPFEYPLWQVSVALCLDSWSVPGGTGQSTVGSEVERPAEPWWAVSAQSVLRSPHGLVLQVIFLPSLPFAFGLIYRHFSAHRCPGENMWAWSIKGWQSEARRGAVLTEGLSNTNVLGLPSLCCWIPFPGQPQQWKRHQAHLFAPFSNKIHRAPFPFAYLCSGSRCHYSLRHSPVHSADQGDPLCCIHIVKNVKEHTGFLKISWLQSVF